MLPLFMMASPPTAASRYAALTVLVADDDADMRAYLARSLGLFGVGHVLLAEDSRQALALAHSADLVISDVMMPGLGGEALCRALHARAPGLPVLLISGEPPLADSDADDFLAKPFNAEALRAHVVPLLDCVLPM